MAELSEKYMQDIEGIDVLTPRIKALRQSYYDAEVHICPVRSHLATESWKETECQPLHLRVAEMFAKICNGIPIVIFDNELIVGSQTAFIRGVGIALENNPKIGLEIEEGDRRLRAEQTRGFLNDGDLQTIISDTYYWKGKSASELVLKEVQEAIGPVYEEISRDLFARTIGAAVYEPSYDFGKILRYGLKGIISEIQREMSNLRFTSVDDGRKLNFLRAVMMCCETTIQLARRYAEKARHMAVIEPNKNRKEELETIADICTHVPENPARSFWEALQALRFLHLGLYLEHATGNGSSLERIDQYLYPFYKSDLEQGKLTAQRAAELLAAFWVKVGATEAIVPGSLRSSGQGYINTRAILGGVDRNGNDASNELTYLILHVVGQIKMGLPVYFRWHANTSNKLMLKAIATNIQMGSEPAFHNDEQTIPGLVADGASLEDARDYTQRGCSHPLPYGGLYGHYHFLNGGKILELVMNDGYDPRTGKQFGIKTGNPRQFTSIDDWISAFFKQWDYLYDIVLKGINISALLSMDVCSSPFTAILTPDSIQKGLSVHEGGARYLSFASDIYNKLYADVADSLVAIKELVYKQHKFTINELLEECANNFESERGAQIRKMLLTAPKFGNDLGEPEEMYRLLNDHVAAFGLSRKGQFGYPKRDARLAGAVYNAQGRITGALPNGRKAGALFSDGGISPCAGCDTRGPTVTLRSVAKALDFKINRSAVLNMKMPKSLLGTDEQKSLLAALVETYFRDYNGYQIQWTIEDREVYLAAQADPEAHKDLLVRIGGFSVYFVELDPVIQDQIISRTEQVWT